MLGMLGLLMLAAVAQVGQGETLVEYLSHSRSFRTMYSLLQDAGLLEALKTGNHTLFIPPDTYLQRYLSASGLSLSQLRQDPERLKDILLYHVVNGTYSAGDLYNEEKLTALNGETIRINTYANKRSAQGVAIQGQHKSDNGNVEVLYGIMEPANDTVANVIASQSDLSTLLAAAKAAGLVDFLADQNPITVFAPTDDAFNALGDKVQQLLANPDLLAQILSYHVVPGTIYTMGLHSEDLHTFEEADRLHISSRFGQSFTVENGHVMRRGDDLSATNGVVHKIDHVLIPDSLASQI